VSRVEAPAEPGDELSKWINDISKRLLEPRKNAKMTQQMLAEASEIPPSHISQLENGEHSPTEKTLEELAKGLNISIKDLDPGAE